MKKQFVTYEISIALKELGFNEPCIALFVDETFTMGISMMFAQVITAPLWQQVVDYFRTKHNIVIELTRFEHRDDIIEWVYIIEKWDGNVIVEYNDCEHFNSYEEAREAAILEAIKLVKENKK